MAESSGVENGLQCQLADLFVRSSADADGNAQPIDVSRVNGVPSMYAGQMDYQMEGFNYEAVAQPQDSCTVSRMTESTTMVDPGSYAVAEVLIQSVDGSDTSQLYRVNVSRLLGTETQIRNLQIANAILVPDWDPLTRNYTAFLDVSEDIIKMTLQKLDNSQLVRLNCMPQAPQATSQRRLQTYGNDLGPPIGEVQYSPLTYITTIDVGYQRIVQLAVASADRSSEDRYTFLIKRPFCPQERRFFDGVAKVCTDICNEGYFGNPSTGRCSACLDQHCAACESGLDCSLCLEGFRLQGGKCVSNDGPDAVEQLQQQLAGSERYARKHLLLVLGATGAVSVALCACVLVMCMSDGRQRKARFVDVDDDSFSNSDYYGAEDTARNWDDAFG